MDYAKRTDSERSGERIGRERGDTRGGGGGCHLTKEKRDGKEGAFTGAHHREGAARLSWDKQGIIKIIILHCGCITSDGNN